AVALGYAQPGQRAGEPGRLVSQLPVGQGSLGPGDRGVVDQRSLVRSSAVHMAVQGVVAGGQAAAAEPPVEGRVAVVQDGVRPFIPVDGLSRLRPETGGVGEAAVEGFVVSAHNPEGKPAPAALASIRSADPAEYLAVHNSEPSVLVPG